MSLRDAGEQSAKGRAHSVRTVEGQINYFSHCEGTPLFYAQDHSRNSWVPEPHLMTITDARALPEPPALEREGVMLVPQTTRLKNFDDKDELARVYLPEMERLLLELTGAARVVTLPAALVRFSARSPRYKTGQNTQPALFAHIDRTPKTAPGLGWDHFGAKAAALEPGQRLKGYNLWRVLSEPPQDAPLAVCDQRSVAAEDLVVAEGVYDYGKAPWTHSEAYVVRYSPAHRWLYFSAMRPGELMIFRSYDWGPVWTAGVPHCAFLDPTCPPDAPARVSIEARAYAVFDA